MKSILDAVKMQAACHFNQLCLKVESLKLIKNSRGPSNLQQIEKLFVSVSVAWVFGFNLMTTFAETKNELL